MSSNIFGLCEISDRTPAVWQRVLIIRALRSLRSGCPGACHSLVTDLEDTYAAVDQLRSRSACASGSMPTGSRVKIYLAQWFH